MWVFYSAERSYTEVRECVLIADKERKKGREPKSLAWRIFGILDHYNITFDRSRPLPGLRKQERRFELLIRASVKTQLK